MKERKGRAESISGWREEEEGRWRGWTGEGRGRISGARKSVRGARSVMHHEAS